MNEYFIKLETGSKNGYYEMVTMVLAGRIASDAYVQAKKICEEWEKDDDREWRITDMHKL